MTPAATTFEWVFDYVVVLEALQPNDRRTGEAVHANFVSPYGRQAGIATELVRCDSPAAFLAALEQLAERASAQDLAPLLHLECHGNVEGIEVGGQVLKWSQLVPMLGAINLASRANLFVIAAACEGALFTCQNRTAERAAYCRSGVPSRPEQSHGRFSLRLQVP